VSLDPLISTDAQTAVNKTVAIASIVKAFPGRLINGILPTQNHVKKAEHAGIANKAMPQSIVGRPHKFFPQCLHILASGCRAF
jgi:hypothetical protein